MIFEWLIGGLIIGGVAYLKGKEVLESDNVKDEEGVNKLFAASKELGSELHDYAEKKANEMEKEIERERRRRERNS